MSETATYPVFLRFQGRHAVLVGGGRVAASKLAGLLAAGARVRVVAPEVAPEMELPDVEIRRRAFLPEDLDGAFFVVAAAPPEVNRQVREAADARGMFVNAVDDARVASAFLGGVVRKGGVTVAIATEGRAPALAGLLREALERVLPDDLSAWVETGERLRAGWREDGIPMGARRPLLLRALLELYPEEPATGGARSAQHPKDEPASPTTGGARSAQHSKDEPASPATGGARSAQHSKDEPASAATIAARSAQRPVNETALSVTGGARSAKHPEDAT